MQSASGRGHRRQVGAAAAEGAGEGGGVRRDSTRAARRGRISDVGGAVMVITSRKAALTTGSDDAASHDPVEVAAHDPVGDA